MKILSIHADFIEFEAKKKAFKGAEEGIKEGLQRVNECLVIFTAFEKADEQNVPLIIQKYMQEIKNIAQQVNAQNIVLYPYAHLSSNLGNPQMAEQMMKDAEKALAAKFKVTRAPFGWYKAFDIKCKGHPLSELSRELSADGGVGIKKNIEEAKAIVSKESISDNETYKRLVDFLEKNKAKYRFIDHPPEGRTAIVSKMRGNTLSQAAHCIIVALHLAKNEKKYVLAVVPGDSKVNMEALKKLYNASYASFAEKEAAERLSRSVSGTILPFSFNQELEVVVDPSLLHKNDELFFNAARLDRSVALRTEDYKRLSKARLEEIAIVGVSNESKEHSEKPATPEQSLSLDQIKALLKQVSRSRLDTTNLKPNDHRIIGKDLDLWSFHDVAPGMVFWHAKGLLIKNLLIQYWREVHQRNDYLEISTPQIMDKKLWQISGHWDKYKENNFVTKYEQRDFLVKPMNCPGGMLVYKSSSKSYKDLPLRVGELGVVHRQELSGVLSGLFRVIQFTQDDAHLFCTEDQVEAEIEGIINIINEMFATFNLQFDHVELSTRPEKRIGAEEIWDLSEAALEAVLKKKKMPYKINAGDGAFYGPKIDFHLKDSLGRTWQCSTIQMDMSMPERFEAEYIDRDGKVKRPIMLHRVVYGAIERFIGILTEHLNGKFPLWLNPVQLKVVTITDAQIPFAKSVVERLKIAGFRVELDDRTETMGRKVREAQMQKVNYILTIGEKEMKNKTVAVRDRDGKTTFDVQVDTFIKRVQDEVKNRTLN